MLSAENTMVFDAHNAKKKSQALLLNQFNKLIDINFPWSVHWLAIEMTSEWSKLK